MIVNMHLNNIDTTFRDVTDDFLPNHEVCLMYMHVKLRKPISHGLVTLASSLVDRSSTNPKQELASFYNYSFYDLSSDRIVYQPTHLKWYKLQCQHIGDAVFELLTEKPLETENNQTKIEKIYVQLAFRKICKDSTHH